MKVLVVGSGGREHALAWKLSQSSRLTELHAAPGTRASPRSACATPFGRKTPRGCSRSPVSWTSTWSSSGRRLPLVAGVADALRKGGLAVFGPSRGRSRDRGVEAVRRNRCCWPPASRPPSRSPSRGRRAWSRPTGSRRARASSCVESQGELDEALRAVLSLGGDFVVEELLEGEEVSLFALCDGSRALPLAPAQDFKRAYDGDEGPNTGGMGAYSPVGQVGSEDAAELAASIHEPVLRSWPVAMRRSSGSCTRG